MGEKINVMDAEKWREIGADDALKAIETAISAIEEDLKGEALDEPSTLARVLQLLDLSAKFQELATDIVQGEAESRETL